jgi:hypothetical protein
MNQTMPDSQEDTAISQNDLYLERHVIPQCPECRGPQIDPDTLKPWKGRRAYDCKNCGGPSHD